MRLAVLGHVLGQFLLGLLGLLLIPLAVSLWSQNDTGPLINAAVIIGGTGSLLCGLLPRPEHDLSQREGLLLVFIIWFSTCIFGALPFYFSPYFSSFTDAFFEATSGFTASGATVLSDVESLSMDLQLWRCLSHWMGGMGVVLLGIAILPLLGIGGMSMYRAEFSGAKSEKLKPRLIDTARALWKIYVSLTLVAYVALRWAGMNIFDAICHSFSTIATGGFSSRNASIAFFDNPQIELVIAIFMLMASINFTLHYRVWVERRLKFIFADIELKCLLSIIGVATLAILCFTMFNGGFDSTTLRKIVFQVISITTTTGFTVDDFPNWLPLPQLIILALMFIGGCTGSTSGGLKNLRIFLIFKVVGREFQRMVERRGIFAIRLGDQVIPETTVRSLLNLIYLSLIVNILSCILLAISGVDVYTSIGAVVATLFNVGPNLGSIGGLNGYGLFSDFSKWVLSFCMLAGRLEFYSMLVIFTPVFWRQ